MILQQEGVILGLLYNQKVLYAILPIGPGSAAGGIDSDLLHVPSTVIRDCVTQTLHAARCDIMILVQINACHHDVQPDSDADRGGEL